MSNLLQSAAKEDKLYDSYFRFFEVQSYNKTFLDAAIINNKTLYFTNEAGVTLEKKELKNLINKICELDSSSFIFAANNTSITRGSNRAISFDNSVVCVKNFSPSLYVDAISLDKEFIEKINTICVEFLLQPKAHSGHDLFIIGKNDLGKLELFNVGDASFPLNRDNYNELVLSKYDNILDDLNNEVPIGRVTLLRGEPGTGKTFLIKGLLHNIEKRVMPIIVPSNMIESLSGPELLSLLLSYKEDYAKDYFLLILEDADFALVKRETNNMGALSVILNFGDGMLGGLLDIRIIATTNSDVVEIDAALQREGRLNEIIGVDALTCKKANSLLETLLPNITERDRFFADVPLSKVYHKAKKLGWKTPKEVTGKLSSI